MEGREDFSVTDKGQVQFSSVPHPTEGPDEWINRGQRMSPLLSISLSFISSLPSLKVCSTRPVKRIGFCFIFNLKQVEKNKEKQTEDSALPL